MSDSGDTDDLLLIPPDLFISEELAEAYASGPYLEVVDSLITQMNKLENRVNTMENLEVDSSRRFSSSDDLQQDFPQSSFSTPQKPRVRYVMNSLPNSPEKRVDKALNMKELDEMLREIQSQKSLNESRLREAERVPKSYQIIEVDAKNEFKVPKVPRRTMVSKLMSDSTVSSDSTQTTARWNHEAGPPMNDEFNKLMLGKEQRLLSLKDLWHRQGQENYQTFKEKLEEEKLRRQHCEQMIGELQGRVLELQERLAVAVEVDQSKDQAIYKFHEAWESIAQRLQSLVKERDSLETDLKELQTRSLEDLNECQKKISHYENEASKALNLAHGNQEKLVEVESKNSEMCQNFANLQTKIQQMDQKIAEEVEKNRQLAEIVAQKELELNDSKNVLTESRREVGESKRAVEVCQAEIANIKIQYTQLELLLNDKQAHIKDLETQKRNVMLDNENLKVLHKSIQGELTKLKETSEKTKQELRSFYQQQLEIVVRDKLKEFQGQLDKAETSFHEEIKNRELAIARTAALHIQQLTEKHSIEVDLLEEKHQEEVRLYQVQLSQSQQQIQHLQDRLAQQDERKVNIAQQLHKVMEAQWLEALRIINNSKTPVQQEKTMEQLHSLKSKSYCNLEEILSERNGESEEVAVDIQETPVSSKLYRGRQQIENDLQKYVQMLLCKQNSEDKYEGKVKGKSSKPPWK